MKALVVPKYGTEDDIIIKEVIKKSVKKDELLIKVHYAPITPTDLTSTKEDSFIFKVFATLFRPKQGIYGEMYCGVVDQVGSEVTGFKEGDLVYGTNGMKLGTYANYVLVNKKTVIRKIPDNINEKEVLALLDGGITALPFLRDKGKVKRGMNILIIGASGSVGSSAVGISKHYGLEVTGVSGTTNQELMKNLGCDYTIDYTKEDYAKDTIKYDVIFDSVGKSSFKICKNILKDQGRYMTTVPTLRLMFKTIFKIKGKGKQNLFAATGLRKVNLKQKDLDILEKMLASRDIKPFIEKTYNHDQLAQAQKHVRTGHKKGNVIIDLRNL